MTATGIDTTQGVFLALIQGLTEFLPVSSSAHLILVPVLMGWPDQGLAFDVAVHVGTLLAVLVYFRSEVAAMLKGWIGTFSGRRSKYGDLAWCVMVATIPVGVAGLLLNDFVEGVLRSPLVIAVATIGFGLLLWISDRYGTRTRSLDNLGWKQAVLIGCAQILALVPGASRSGVTMTAALALGYSRRDGSRFSFLLSIPVILLAGAFKTFELVSNDYHVNWSVFAIGTIVAAVSAYVCIDVFLRVIERTGMTPFVIYRLVLGIVLLAWFV